MKFVYPKSTPIFFRFTRLHILLCFLLPALVPTHASAQVDTTIGIKTPKGRVGNYKKLAHALCDSLENDRQKANAIYNWITHHVRYDVKAMQQGRLKEEKPEKVFKQRKGMCEGYSLLFAAMCNEVGVKALVLDGYAKDWMFDDGDKLYIPRHAWNAVYVDNKWQLADVTWGAGGVGQAPGWLKRQIGKAAKDPTQASGKLRFQYRYNPNYFLTDPLSFRVRHLPSDPLWQLTDSIMPLQVFEAGQIAIQNFNTANPDLVQNLPELDLLQLMDERERVQVSAERVAAYNPRFHIYMAAKHQSDAVDTLAKAKGRGYSSALTIVEQRLKQAEQEVNAQKTTIATEYKQLKTKNKTKNLQAKQYLQSIHSDNKRMITQCESHTKKLDTRVASIKQKAAIAGRSSKHTNAGKLSEIETAGTQEPVTSTMLRALEDSVQQRNNRIGALKKNIEQQQSLVSALRETNGNRLDSLADIFQLADSALTKETIARLNMHDNYDEEVLQWNRIVKTARLQQVDTLQRHYFAGYDSVAQNYEALRKLQWAQIELFHKNLKDIEQYKRKNKDNTKLFAQYPALVAEHNNCMSAYYQTLGKYEGYIQGNKKLVDELVKLYKRQEKLVGYMEKSEEKRQQLEEKNLTKKEDFDKKENDKQKDLLKETGKKAERLLAKG